MPTVEEFIKKGYINGYYLNLDLNTSGGYFQSKGTEYIFTVAVAQQLLVWRRCEEQSYRFSIRFEYSSVKFKNNCFREYRFGLKESGGGKKITRLKHKPLRGNKGRIDIAILKESKGEFPPSIRSHVGIEIKGINPLFTLLKDDIERLADCIIDSDPISSNSLNKCFVVYGFQLDNPSLPFEKSDFDPALKEFENNLKDKIGAIQVLKLLDSSIEFFELEKTTVEEYAEYGTEEDGTLDFNDAAQSTGAIIGVLIKLEKKSMILMDKNIIGYKETPIGLIPTDWEVKKLGDLGDVIGGLTYNPDDINEEEGILVLRSSNIQDGQLVFDDNVFVKVKPEEFNPVQKDDILICVRNGSKSLIGKNALITEKAEGLAFGAFMALYRSEHNRFLYQVFDTDIYYKEIHQNLGATINSINGSDFKLFKIPFPPIPEQQKIAAILSTWDVAIDHCKAIIEKLKERNKGLAQQLLTGKMRVKEFEGKWKNYSLGDITDNFSSRNKELVDARIYSVTNTNGFVFQSDHFSREVAGDDLNNYKIIKKNEFAYNPARINVGSIAYFENEIGVISSLYVCFKTKKEVVDKYLLYWLSIEKTQHDISRYGEGGVRIYLWYELFATIKIELPSVEEQKAIVNILDTATAELNQYQQNLQALQLQKKGLMQQLLTGKIRVKVDIN